MNKYNLIQLVEAWSNKEITEEKMKELYAEIPVFIEEQSTGGDPDIAYSGSGNTIVEVQSTLVYTHKITIDQFHEWVNIVKDTERVNIEK